MTVTSIATEWFAEWFRATDPLKVSVCQTGMFPARLEPATFGFGGARFIRPGRRERRAKRLVKPEFASPQQHGFRLLRHDGRYLLERQLLCGVGIFVGIFLIAYVVRWRRTKRINPDRGEP
jgi:hypothetical protein